MSMSIYVLVLEGRFLFFSIYSSFSMESKKRFWMDPSSLFKSSHFGVGHKGHGLAGSMTCS